MTKLYTNAMLVQDGRESFVNIVVENDLIHSILPVDQYLLDNGDPVDEIVDCVGAYVSHGYIDIHVHGGGGHDFMDNTLDAYEGALNLHLKHGTTALMPTTVASSVEKLEDALKVYELAEQELSSPVRLLGMHIEGPYLAEKQAGAQDPKYIRDPNPSEYETLVERYPFIRRWTIAPERPGALEMGDFLLRHGILPSAGHSDATYEEMVLAKEHGYTLLTHLYSAMSTIVRKLGFRYAGLVESAYLLDDVNVEIIADGYHLPDSLLQMVHRFIGYERTALITDAMRGAGMPEGDSILGAQEGGLPVILEGGVAKLPDRSAFAGSMATADQLITNMVNMGGASLAEAIHMMTKTPAEILGISDTTGSVLPGRKADLCIFTFKNEKIELLDVLIDGQTAWRN